MRRVEKKDKTRSASASRTRASSPTLPNAMSVVPQLGFKVAELGALVDGLDARRDIPQIEFIAGDAGLRWCSAAAAVRCRQAKLEAFGAETARLRDLPANGRHRLRCSHCRARPQLTFRMPQWDVELLFRPLDFIQVNAKLNQAMIARALDLLDVQPGERASTCSAASATSPCRWRARQR